MSIVRNKHALVVAAMMATLTVTACGKKKDVVSAPPSAPTDTQKNPDSQTPGNNTSQNQEGNTDGSLGGGLPNPQSGGDESYNPPSPDSQNSEPTPIPEDDDKKPRRPGTMPPVVHHEPGPRGNNPVPPDYNPVDHRNVDVTDYAKRFTGGVADNGLLYTSSSTDEILNFLRARNLSVGPETRRMNERAAASVLSAKMSVDSLSGDAIVTLKVQEPMGVATYNVAGSSASGPANPLKLVSSGNGEKTTGTRSLSGTWKCLDLDGGCENVFVRLVIGSSPNSAIINVVFRNSSSDVWFSFASPENQSMNMEFLRLKQLAMDSYNRDLRSSNRLKRASMKSWEVVNGRSGVILTMKTYENELLAFAGPLLAPEAGTGVNLPLARLGADQQTTSDLIIMNNDKLNFQNTLSGARLVANNTLGQVKIELTMRKRVNFPQDKFAVTFMRKIKPLVELSDENLR